MTAVRTCTVLAVAALIGALSLEGNAAETAADDRRALHAPGLRGCRLLPHRDAFHRRVDGLPEARNSDAIVGRILADGVDYVHPYFGASAHYGIPYEIVGFRQRRVPIKITLWPDQSERGRQPIPRDARIENGRRSGEDRHVLVLQRDGPDANRDCRLIELYRAFPPRPGAKRWRAGSVAVFDLGERLPQRPAGWTSADAAGLPILPGLVRYPEVASGRINHAIRVGITRTRRAYLSPASHFSSDECDPWTLPPMGLRLRLDDDYPIAWMSEHARVIAKALKTYGVIVADNGSNFSITGARDRRWSDQALNDLKTIPGARFEVVKTGAKLTEDCPG
jgi:hypothetical protein